MRSPWVLIAVIVSMVAGPAMAQPTAPVNDDFSTATAVQTDPSYSETVDLSTATRASDDPTDCFMNATVWYRYTPAVDGRVEVVTEAVGFDERTGVFSGARGSLAEVACSTGPTLRFPVDGGTTYHLEVGAVEGPPGSVEIEIREAPPEVRLDLDFDTTGWLDSASGAPALTGTLDCSGPALDVGIEIEVTQSGYGTEQASTIVDCLDRARFLVPFTGYFGAGRASIDATASFEADGVVAQESDVTTLISCTRIGTMNRDRMVGGPEPEVFCGLDGNDRMLGGRGKDVLRGALGADVMSGDEANDLLLGGVGADRLSGDAGNDVLVGDDGSDVLMGGPGKDRCSGGPGADRKEECER